MSEWDVEKPPLYGCLTGIELPVEAFNIAPGLVLRSVFVDMFGTSMLAFAPPPNPSAPHPAPWVAVKGGYAFQSRVELAVTDALAFDALSPSVAAWLVAAMFRLRMKSPVRMAVLANRPFDELQHQGPWPLAFESATQQIGPYSTRTDTVGEDDLRWLRASVPMAARFYHDERFFRAFSVYDQAQWSPTLAMGMVLVWTAIETLFDLGGKREKTKAICRALSDYVANGTADRDRAYQVIRNLYAKRGGVVHAGARVTLQDAMQSWQFAKVAFRRCIADGKLPPSSGLG